MRRPATSEAENSVESVEPLKGTDHDSSDDTTTSRGPPVGHWKDGLWDFCRYGPLHATVLHSCCCIAIAAGQVVTRLKLNPWGTPIYTGAFQKFLILSLSFWIVRVFLLIIIALLDPNTESEEWIEPSVFYHIVVAVDNLLAYLYMAFTALLLWFIRSQIRSKYAIPQEGYCATGCEDFCCSFCCPCLVMAQMMRHTADYDTYSARCCTETGLPPNAPSIV